MFAEAGNQFGQLQILQSEKILATYLILFEVERSVIDDAAIESTENLQRFRRLWKRHRR